MELGVREIVTFLGMAVSVGASMSIVRTKLQVVIESLQDIESRLRVVDQRVDQTEITSQRVDILSSMMSPAEREKGTREIERVKANLDYALAEISHLKKLHNGSHVATRSLD
tara:strand:- start:422 stop:757 length:336 start_codon:yes stop_codon:yes gene_type:complete